MSIDKSNIVKKIFEVPDEVETGLKMLDKDVKISDHGSIDVIGVDSSKRLVLIEIGLDDNPQILVDALGCFNWIDRNEDIVRRLYGPSDVDYTQKPRLLVMVPHLSDRFLRISSYVSLVGLDLFEYNYVPSLDGLVIEKVDSERFRGIEKEQETVTQAVKPLYAVLKNILHEAFEKLEIFEIGLISLITLGDRILARVSFTQDFLIIDMVPDGILEIKDESGLENVVSVLRARAEKFGISLNENPAKDFSSLPSLTKQELEALRDIGEKKESDASYNAETETE